jgi:hypothetical protein
VALDRRVALIPVTKSSIIPPAQQERAMVGKRTGSLSFAAAVLLATLANASAQELRPWRHGVGDQICPQAPNRMSR